MTDTKDFSTIKFHPCPYHFPDMWKHETLWKSEPTAEDIRDMRDLYMMPEDGSEKAIEFCRIWGVKSMDEIAKVYARIWRYDSHGFLVLDKSFVGPRWGVIESLDNLVSIFSQLDINSASCLVRAKEFGVTKEHPRRNWVGAMSHSHTVSRYCYPTAMCTWPFPSNEKMWDKVCQYRKEHYDLDSYDPALYPPYWMTSLMPWFVIKKLGLSIEGEKP